MHNSFKNISVSQICENINYSLSTIIYFYEKMAAAIFSYSLVSSKKQFCWNGEHELCFKEYWAHASYTDWVLV